MLDNLPECIICEMILYVPSIDLLLINKSIRKPIYEKHITNIVVDCGKITRYNKKSFLRFLKNNRLINKFINITSVYRLKQILKIVKYVSELSFEEKFNQKIDVSQLPQTLINLDCGCRYNQKINFSNLPQSLNYIRISWNYTHDIDISNTPKSFCLARGSCKTGWLWLYND
jgi:hypothetical protein